MPEQASDQSQVDAYQDDRETYLLVQADPSDPDWRLHTLRQTVGERLAQQFFWKAETDTIQTYEHRLTYRFVHVDRLSGQFYNQGREPISAEAAMAHALPSFDMTPAPALPVAAKMSAGPVLRSMMLAPIVLEPDLAPFVRREDAELLAVQTGTGSSGSPGRIPGSFSRLYQSFRVKLLALNQFAQSASVPQRELVRESRGNLQNKELSVAAFTRRAA